LPQHLPQQQQRQEEGVVVDGHAAASLLRRLLLWPVTPELLKHTGAGKLVARLKKHPNTVVRG
jgi:hypothetical protein